MSYEVSEILILYIFFVTLPFLALLSSIRKTYILDRFKPSMKGQELKEAIFKYIKKKGTTPTTVSEIRAHFHISYPTVQKWLAFLEGEKKILVNHYGNIKFYYRGDLKR